MPKPDYIKLKGGETTKQRQYDDSSRAGERFCHNHYQQTSTIKETIMAAITVPALVVTNVNNTTVNLRVSYTLTPSAIEKLAGTVFSENIQAIGDDAGVLGDIVITTFPTQVFAVNATTTNVPVTRTRNVLKSNMNEDSGFLTTGAEQSDEVFARVTITYAANAPAAPTLPPPGKSATVTGAWKG